MQSDVVGLLHAALSLACMWRALACSKGWWQLVADGDEELGRLSLQLLLPFFVLGQDECEEMSDIAA